MRALPLLLLVGGGVAALLVARRASAAAPLYLPEADAYEPGWQQASPTWSVPPWWGDPYRPPPLVDPAVGAWNEFQVQGDRLELETPPMAIWDLPADFGVLDPTPPGAFDYLDSPSTTAEPDAYREYDMSGDANLNAFLWAIRVAEGTANAAGYRTMFGYRYFDDFSDHPRQPAKFFDQKSQQWLWTSAAGAYQFMAVSPIPGGGSTRVDTWDRVQRRLALPDFSPASQDSAAIELIREKDALADVRAGHFAAAVFKVKSTWASLPGAGYGQPERKLGELQTAYLDAGGALA